MVLMCLSTLNEMSFSESCEPNKQHYPQLYFMFTAIYAKIVNTAPVEHQHFDGEVKEQNTPEALLKLERFLLKLHDHVIQAIL